MPRKALCGIAGTVTDFTSALGHNDPQGQTKIEYNPTAFMSMANSVPEASALWHTICVCFALIGIYLTYVGWIPAPDRPISQAASSTPGLPRAL